MKNNMIPTVPPWWSGVMTWHPATVWACGQGARLAEGKEVGGARVVASCYIGVFRSPAYQNRRSPG